MLVLSRKERQSIVIDNTITVTINRVSGNRVTVGIEAPYEVPIVRGEMAHRIASATLPPEVKAFAQNAAKFRPPSPEELVAIVEGIRTHHHIPPDEPVPAGYIQVIDRYTSDSYTGPLAMVIHPTFAGDMQTLIPTPRGWVSVTAGLA